MFLTSAIALLIQPNTELLAYNDLNPNVASKIELTIPEISKKEVNKIRRAEKKNLKTKTRVFKIGKSTSENAPQKNNKISKKKIKETKKKFNRELATFDFSMPNFHKSQEEKELDYVYKIRKRELKEQYEKSLMPKSGYMTVAQYEAESRVKDKTKEDRDFKPPIQDKDMKYLPQPVYKLVRYNDPPGSPDLQLSRKYKFERKENNYGLVANDLKSMVYPVVYYYADRNVTTCDVFVVPLDTSIPDTQRILKANVAKRWQKPILETEKDTEVRNTFRTMTPIDFNIDHTKLVAKEKIGNTFDGIWQTNVWTYDFLTKKATNLTEIRQAILHYWEKEKHFELSEYRWDIYPLGFDKNHGDRVLINAYAFTGGKPKFLGAWSIDYNGQYSKLESLENQSMEVSVIGFKLIQAGVKDPKMVKAETKHLEDVKKIEEKELKEAKKQEKKEKEFVYKRQLKQLKEEFKIKRKNLKKSLHKRKSGPTS